MAFFHNKKNFLQAARKGDAAEVAYCLTFAIPLKFSIDSQDEQGNTALNLAARNGDIAVIKLLLQYGADADLSDKAGVTPLQAAMSGGKSFAALALIEGGANPDTHGGDYVYPLHLAAFGGELDIVKALQQKGADLNVAIRTNGRTPLHWAVEKENGPVVEFLVRSGARTDIADKNGKTALDLAKRKNLPHILKLMNPAGKPPESAEGAEGWSLAGKNRVSHTGAYPDIGRKLTEIFNFESRERIVITENLKTGAETVGTPENFDAVSEDALRKALAEFRSRGGEADEAFVLGARAAKKSFNL